MFDVQWSALNGSILSIERLFSRRVFGIVMVAFIGILCHMFWEHVVKKRPVPDWKPSNDHYGEGTGGP